MEVVKRYDGDDVIVELWRDGWCYYQYRFTKDALSAILKAFKDGVGE